MKIAEPIIDPATIVIESNSERSALSPMDPAASAAASAILYLPILRKRGRAARFRSYPSPSLI
jgi:hypothetical protein